MGRTSWGESYDETFAGRLARVRTALRAVGRAVIPGRDPVITERLLIILLLGLCLLGCADPNDPRRPVSNNATLNANVYSFDDQFVRCYVYRGFGISCIRK